MLQGVSERFTAFVRWVRAFVLTVRAYTSKQGSGSSSGFLVRPDGRLGRMEIISVGPGFDLHLQHVQGITVTRDIFSGNFRFQVDMADRATITHEHDVHAALEEISRNLAREKKIQ